MFYKSFIPIYSLFSTPFMEYCILSLFLSYVVCVPSYMAFVFTAWLNNDTSPLKYTHTKLKLYKVCP